MIAFSDTGVEAGALLGAGIILSSIGLPNSRLTNVLACAALALAIGRGLGFDKSAMLLGVLGVAVGFVFVNILVHEAGHLLAGSLVGWRPYEMEIGIGVPWAVLSILDIEVRLGHIAGGGTAYAIPRSANWYRSKHLVFTLGGPLASIGFGGIICLLIANQAPNEASAPWTSLLWILFYAECFTVGLSLWPHHFRRHGRKHSNDGLHAIQILRLKPSESAQQYHAHTAQYAAWLAERERWSEVIDYIQPLIDQETPYKEWLIQLRIASLFLRGCDAQALEECTAHIDAAETMDKRATRLDVLACIPLTYDCPESIPHALGFIDRAIIEQPDALTYLGTKGSLLVEAGDLEGGIRLLEEVAAKSKAQVDQEYCAYYLAFAVQKRGEKEKAAQLVAAAIRAHPAAQIRRHVERKMKTLVTAGDAFVSP